MDLKMAGLEAPTKIVERLKSDGIFEPKLKKGQVVHRQKEMRESGLMQEDQKVDDLFLEEEQVVPLAGILVMEEETTEELEQEVLRALAKYAKSIHDEWMLRHVQSNLEAAASAMLGVAAVEDDVPEDDDSDGEEEGADASWSRTKKIRFKKLKHLIELLPGRQGQRFDPIIIFPGLESWLTYLKNSRDAEHRPGEHEVYKSWFKSFVSCERALESNVLFSKLFQNLQIRSSSEVRQKEKLENKFYPGDCGDSRQHYEPSRGEEQVTFKILST
jgi:hypothetical protein